MNEAILDEGLRLAMAWGEDWLKPIQSRLTKLHPELSADELEAYNTIAQEVMRFGWEQAASFGPSENPKDDLEVFAVGVHKRYSWVSQENLSQLFSQGMYYAWK